jgi:hypothetical protein
MTEARHRHEIGWRTYASGFVAVLLLASGVRAMHDQAIASTLAQPLGETGSASRRRGRRRRGRDAPVDGTGAGPGKPETVAAALMWAAPPVLVAGTVLLAAAPHVLYQHHPEGASQ